MVTAMLYVPVMLFGVGLLPAMLRWSLQSRSGSHVLVSLAFAILTVASVIDWLRLSGQSAFVGVYLVAYSINAVMLFFGGLLVWRLAQSLNTTRQLATLLDHQVAVRTADLEQANRKLAEMAITDSLTGIANRRHFDEMLSVQWNRARRLGQPLVLLLLDVDHFKKYNDHFGHPAGDDCLRRVAKVLQRHARHPDDVAARYGGEEFALVSLASAEQGRQLAEAIRQAIAAEAIAHSGSPYGQVTISVGVATAMAADPVTPGELLTRADQALYRAKDGGRNRIEMAPPAAGAGQDPA
jgi:diguanylate cyclase (GGDEF)-like protein